MYVAWLNSSLVQVEKRLRFAMVLILNAILLARCLNLEYKVSLKQDGSGTIKAIGLPKAPLPADESIQILGHIEGGEVQVRNLVREKMFSRQEILRFSRLNELAWQEASIKVTPNKSKSILNLGSKIYTYTHTIFAPPIEIAEEGITQSIFSDRYFTYSLEGV